MIREATFQDIPAMLDIYRPYVLETTVTFEYEVPSLEEFTLRFQTITENFPWIVWEEDGNILGYCYGARVFERAAYQWAAELSVYLRPDFRGHGIGRKLYEALEQSLRRQGYRLLYGIVTTENIASCKFHLAMGYRTAAELPRCAWKFGNCCGITWFEKRLNDQDPLTSPVSWRKIR